MTGETKTNFITKVKQWFSVRFLVSLGVGFVACFAATLLGPWVLLVVGGAIAGLVAGNWIKGFFSGIISGGLAWGFLVLYYLMSTQAYTLFQQFLGLMDFSSLAFIVPILTAIVGMWLGGIGGLTGGAVYYILEFVAQLIRANTSKESPHAELKGSE